MVESSVELATWDELREIVLMRDNRRKNFRMKNDLRDKKKI